MSADLPPFDPTPIDRSDEIKLSGTLRMRLREGVTWAFLKAWGYEPTAIPLPCHDPPVAWKRPGPALLDQIVFTGFRGGMGEWAIFDVPGEKFPLPVLDHEPGRLS